MCVDIFFFKQKTAYEVRISDWSSDGCSSDLAEESIRALARSLPLILADPADAAARADALYGCWLAGSVLGAVSVALHHKLCHTLGGTFDMPHAQTHTAVLPHAIAY